MRIFIVISVSLILCTIPVADAFIANPYQQQHHGLPLVKSNSQDINNSYRTSPTITANSITKANIQIKPRRSFAIYSSSSNNNNRNQNTDEGVIVPEDGFGSPCVIKVRYCLRIMSASAYQQHS
jgi:hypothetical protein